MTRLDCTHSHAGAACGRIGQRSRAQGRSAACRLGVDEVGDDGAELFASVFLQEVAGTGDHRVVNARRAGHGSPSGGPASTQASRTPPASAYCGG